MQTKTFVRHRHSPAEKARLLEACERSGLTREAFATQQGIALSTLYQWRKQNHRGAQTGRNNWIEVPNLLGGGPAVAPYRLHGPSGWMLEVARGFDAAEVRVLTQLLQGL
jgi:transcriptional regulator with XRE-family HTH domain